MSRLLSCLFGRGRRAEAYDTNSLSTATESRVCVSEDARTSRTADGLSKTGCSPQALPKTTAPRIDDGQPGEGCATESQFDSIGLGMAAALLGGLSFSTRVLGFGSYGLVLKGTLDGADVAVKFMVHNGNRAVVHEVTLAPTPALTHPHICKTYDTRTAVLTDALFDELESHRERRLQRLRRQRQLLQKQQMLSLGGTAGIGGLAVGVVSGSAGGSGGAGAGAESAGAGAGGGRVVNGRGGGGSRVSRHSQKRTSPRQGTNRPRELCFVPDAAATVSPAAAAAAVAGRARLLVLGPKRSDPMVPMESGSPLAALHEVLYRLGATTGQSVTLVVMEYCCKGTLSRAIYRGIFTPCPMWSLRLARRALVRTAAEMARALLHLHNSGVVHGDLKPANVLLKSSRDDRRGFTAKICDFGLSHVLPEGAQSLDSDTWGTPAYMSPEALLGHPSMASDVWSFGVMLSEALTQTPPYGGKIDPARLIMGIITQSVRLDWPAVDPAAASALTSPWSQEEMNVTTACTGAAAGAAAAAADGAAARLARQFGLTFPTSTNNHAPTTTANNTAANNNTISTTTNNAFTNATTIAHTTTTYNNNAVDDNSNGGKITNATAVARADTCGVSTLGDTLGGTTTGLDTTMTMDTMEGGAGAGGNGGGGGGGTRKGSGTGITAAGGVEPAADNNAMLNTCGTASANDLQQPVSTTASTTTAGGAAGSGGAGGAPSRPSGPRDDEDLELVLACLVSLGERCTSHRPEHRPCFSEILGELIDMEIILKTPKHRHHHRGGTACGGSGGSGAAGRGGVKDMNQDLGARARERMGLAAGARATGGGGARLSVLGRAVSTQGAPAAPAAVAAPPKPSEAVTSRKLQGMAFYRAVRAEIEDFLARTQQQLGIAAAERAKPSQCEAAVGPFLPVPPQLQTSPPSDSHQARSAKAQTPQSASQTGSALAPAPTAETGATVACAAEAKAEAVVGVAELCAAPTAAVGAECERASPGSNVRRPELRPEPEQAAVAASSTTAVVVSMTAVGRTSATEKVEADEVKLGERVSGTSPLVAAGDPTPGGQTAVEGQVEAEAVTEAGADVGAERDALPGGLLGFSGLPLKVSSGQEGLGSGLEGIPESVPLVFPHVAGTSRVGPPQGLHLSGGGGGGETTHLGGVVMMGPGSRLLESQVPDTPEVSEGLPAVPSSVDTVRCRGAN